MFSLIAIPLGLAMAYPKTSAKINGFALIFMAVIAPTNPMVFKLSDSLNSAIALTTGTLFGVLAYTLIFPVDPQATRRYIFYRVKRGLESLASTSRIASHTAWETSMCEQANRLYISSSKTGVLHDELTDATMGALALGNELIRLRRLARASLSVELKASIKVVVGTFKQFCSHPELAANEVRDQMNQLSLLIPGTETREHRARARVTGALAEIDRCLALNPALCRN